MNGRTNAKNGAGAIRDGCAVLEIRAPAYSQITVVRADGLIKKQDKGYVDLSDSDYWFYYIIIQKFEINENLWTITQIKNNIETVLITEFQIVSNKKYNIETDLCLFKNGQILNAGLTTKGTAIYSITEQDELEIKLTANDYGAIWFGPIDIGKYEKAEVTASFSIHLYVMPIGIIATPGSPNSENSNITEFSTLVPTGEIDTLSTYTLDLSGYSSPSKYYFGLTLAGTGSYSDYGYSQIKIKSIILYARGVV